MRHKCWFVVPLLLLVCFFYFFFNGNPLSSSEANKLARDFLEERYPRVEFTLSNNGYYPGEGTYIVGFRSLDKEVSGSLDVRNGVIRFEENGDAE